MHCDRSDSRISGNIRHAACRVIGAFNVGLLTLVNRPIAGLFLVYSMRDNCGGLAHCEPEPLANRIW